LYAPAAAHPTGGLPSWSGTAVASAAARA